MMSSKLVRQLEMFTFIMMSFVVVICFACQKSEDEQCGDPFALNYAEGSAGISSCEYPTEERQPTFITDLDDAVEETSGLAMIDNNLITHNDRGGKNELYVIDFNGGVTHTITINLAANIDWEDLAQSDSSIFIGDFGNNDGSRQLYTIYEVDKRDFDFSVPTSTVQVKNQIRYSYPEQGQIEAGSRHNFDCEAMVYFENALYVFTKHRLDNNTVLYRIPNEAGTHQAQMIDSFHAGVRVTGADISADGRTVYLIGYQKASNCVIWELTAFEGDNFLSGEKKKYDLGPFSIFGQMEAVLVEPNQSSLLITSEEVDGIPPRLYRFDLD